jgi:Domain of unknown function (DUF4184)
MRRCCPRWLSFPALVVGSLSPDLGYCLDRWDADRLSHQICGSILFCVPAGLVLLLGFYALRPDSVPRPFLSVGSLSRIVLGLWIGALTHIVWDSFTNRSGWAVLHLPILQLPIGVILGHRVLVCHLLWYACSFAGVCWLVLASQNWRQSLRPPLPPVKHGFRTAILAGLMVLPIGAVHHLTSGWPGRLLVAFLSMALVGTVVWVGAGERLWLRGRRGGSDESS